MKILSWRYIGLVMSVAILCVAMSPASAQEAPPKAEQKEASKEKETGLRGKGKGDWMHRIGLMRAPGEHERNHEKGHGGLSRDCRPAEQGDRENPLGRHSSGLGAVVDPGGYILTKASEIKGKPDVLLADERRFHARIVGIDAQTDLAMLKSERTTCRWSTGPTSRRRSATGSSRRRWIRLIRRWAW